MSAFKFAILVHSDFVADEVRRQTLSLGWNIDIFVTSYDTAREDADRCIREGYDLLICHGGFRYAVLRDHPQKTIFIDRTDFDILRALVRARAYTSEVIVAAHRDEPRDVEFMEKITQMRIHVARYTDHVELEQQLKIYYARGLHIAVGGGGTARYMQLLGGQTILDVPQAINIQQAISRAVHLMAARQREASYTESVRQIMRFSREGAICASLDGDIVYANEEALRLLDVKTQNDVQAWLPSLLTEDLLAWEKPRMDDILTLNRRKLLVSAFPVHLSEGKSVIIFIQDVQSIRSISRKIDKLSRHGFTSRHQADSIVGMSAPTREVRRRILRYASMDAPVYVSGETGTGKELVAHALHAASPRAGGPFVALNCAAMPESLLESELFGYEEGAFTGARRQGKVGLFELAHGGTLFLDEICSISPHIQLLLLRVLETGELLRVGGGRLVQVDIRLISAAQHQRLREKVQDGTFRMDLYYRMVGLSISLPLLRERKEDIPLLAELALRRQGRTRQCLSPVMVRELAEHSWPGNVRELLSIMDIYAQLLSEDQPDAEAFREAFHERVALVDGPGNTPAAAVPSVAAPVPALPSGPDLGQDRGQNRGQGAGEPLKEYLRRCRQNYVRQAVAQCGGNRRQAAHRLDVGYASLRRFLAEGDEEERQ